MALSPKGIQLPCDVALIVLDKMRASYWAGIDKMVKWRLKKKQKNLPMSASNLLSN